MPAAALNRLADTLPDGADHRFRHHRALPPGFGSRPRNAGTPLAVVRPAGTADVQQVLRWAAEHHVAVVPRGAGSGLSGGADAVDGSVILSTERMRDIRIDPATRTAVVQPGLTNTEVERAAAQHGLWYPPDLSSIDISSIGGNAATNAGGLCCVKYGVTGDYVLGMEVVLADGTALRLGGPLLKDVAGLALTKLSIGSEGILGVITELTLRLIPAQPPASTVVALFDSVEDAANAVVAITGEIRPAMLEFMDHASINAAEDHMRMGLDRSARAMLLMQSDAPGAAAAEVATMVSNCEKCGATEVFATDDPAEGAARSSAARRGMFGAVEKLRLLLEDVGVPIPQLPALVTGVEDIADTCDVQIYMVAHAGDGNTHPIIVRPRTDPGRQFPPAPSARSPASWSWPSDSAAPSPASTASDASNGTGCPISWATT